MTDTIRPAICFPSLTMLSETAFHDLDPNSPASRITKALLTLAFSNAQLLRERIERQSLEIYWPSGIPEDVRATLRAQLYDQLSINSAGIVKEATASLISVACKCAPLAIDEMRKELDGPST